MFQLLKESASTSARLGELTTAHGTIPTPIFMPVGTQGTVKAIHQTTLTSRIDAKIILGNTYHLYLRPGTGILSEAGGLHAFMNWPRPILTDSGGYQVFSLSHNRQFEEDGVIFKSHHDGSMHTFTPESVVDIQRVIGSDIMMVLDECPPFPSTPEYVKTSLDRTHRWAAAARRYFLSTEGRYGWKQHQFGIVQGSVYPEWRKISAEFIASLDFEGNAIGGLSVGEPAEMMYENTAVVNGILPKNKPRYLMGVGTPANILESVALGVDMFDCVMPTRNARNGQIFTRNGIVNIRNAKWKTHFKPLDEGFETFMNTHHTAAYLHHLFRAEEILGIMLATEQNLKLYLWLANEIRTRIADGTFDGWYKGAIATLSQRL
jgi:queuine tRNA-ribosyltransferase